MERTLTLRFTPRLVIGLTVLWLGTFWLLDELGYHQIHPLLDLWPAGLILLGVAIAVNGGGWISTLFVGGAGVWLLGESMDLFDVDIGDLWPLVLVFVGIRMIMKGAGARPRAVADPSDRITSVAIFGNRDHKIDAGGFRKADATAILGTSNIDLTNAKFEQGATIDIFCLAGGINITVSPDTRVVSDVVPIMAGYEDKRSVQAAPTQTLHLRGINIWSGVEVHSRLPQDTEGTHGSTS